MKENESSKPKSSIGCFQFIVFFAFVLVLFGIVTVVGLATEGKDFIDKDFILNIQICIGGLVLSAILYAYYRNKGD